MIPKETKILLTLFLVITLLAAAASYYRYMVVSDITFDTEGFSIEEE